MEIKFLLKLSHKLYIFQCIIGLLDGFIMLPLYISMEYFENQAKCYVELVIFFGICNQCTLQMITLALLSVLRYYAISRQRNISGKRVILIYIILYTFAMCAFAIIIWKGDTLHPTLYMYISIFYAITNVILQVIIVSANVMLLKYVRAIKRENNVNNINIDYHKRAIKTILLLSISFISSTLPSAVNVCIYYYLLIIKENEKASAVKEGLQWTYMLFTLYSGINSVIYIFRTKTIVAYYKPIIMNYFVMCRAHCSCNHDLSEIRKREDISTAL